MINHFLDWNIFHILLEYTFAIEHNFNEKQKNEIFKEIFWRKRSNPIRINGVEFSFILRNKKLFDWIDEFRRFVKRNEIWKISFDWSDWPRINNDLFQWLSVQEKNENLFRGNGKFLYSIVFLNIFHWMYYWKRYFQWRVIWICNNDKSISIPRRNYKSISFSKIDYQIHLHEMFVQIKIKNIFLD